MTGRPPSRARAGLHGRVNPGKVRRCFRLRLCDVTARFYFFHFYFYLAAGGDSREDAH